MAIGASEGDVGSSWAVADDLGASEALGRGACGLAGSAPRRRVGARAAMESSWHSLRGDKLLARRRRDVVVDGDERAVRAANATSGLLEAFERLRRRHFVHEVAVDVEESGASRDIGCRAVYQVSVPDLRGHAVRTARSRLSQVRGISAQSSGLRAAPADARRRRRGGAEVGGRVDTLS